jgi:serine/threonine-protein kinase ULK/ATG1
MEQHRKKKKKRKTITIGAWTVVDQEIGKGSFATVYRGNHRETGDMVAVKRINLDRPPFSLNKKHQENLELEIQILHKYQHSNIVRLLHSQKRKKSFYLVMEYCDNGDLAHFITRHKRLPEKFARRLLLQLSNGLEFLVQNNLIHRDLKPQNLLLHGKDPATMKMKIADFGFARFLQQTDMAATLCGTPLYMAPEILKSQRYNAKADLWSVGTILWEMVTGVRTFANVTNQMALLQKIEREDLVPPAYLSRECTHLLHNLLRKDPTSRLSFPAFFQHPYLVLARRENPDLCAPLDLGSVPSTPAMHKEEVQGTSTVQPVSRLSDVYASHQEICQDISQNAAHSTSQQDHNTNAKSVQRSLLPEVAAPETTNQSLPTVTDKEAHPATSVTSPVPRCGEGGMNTPCDDKPVVHTALSSQVNPWTQGSATGNKAANPTTPPFSQNRQHHILRQTAGADIASKTTRGRTTSSHASNRHKTGSDIRRTRSSPFLAKQHELPLLPETGTIGK